MGDSSRGAVVVPRPSKDADKLLAVPEVLVLAGESWTRGHITPSVVGAAICTGGGDSTDTGVVGGGPRGVDGTVTGVVAGGPSGGDATVTGVVGGGPRGSDGTGTDTGLLGGGGGSGVGDGAAGFSGVSPITPLQKSLLPN